MPQCKYYKKKITDTFLRSLKEKTDLQITDSEIPGLQLRYSCVTGSIVFYLCYQVRRSRTTRNMKLGRYGDFSLKDIRLKAIQYRQEVQSGLDPALEIQKRLKALKEQQRRQITVEEALKEYLEKYCKRNNKPNTIKVNDSLIKVHIIPRIGQKAVSELDLADLTILYDDLVAEKSLSIGNHVKTLLSHFLNWCEIFKYRPLNSNPSKLIEKKRDKNKNKKIFYFLNEDEYGRILQAIEKGMGLENYCITSYLAIKTIMLTGCRSSEIRGLAKDELALDKKMLRIKDSKSGYKEVGLGDPAIEVIKQALENNNTDYVFPSPKNPGKSLIDIRRAWAWILEEAKMPHIRIHDMRHSFISTGIAIGESIPKVRDTVCHASSATTELYTHTHEEDKIKTANKIASNIIKCIPAAA